MKVLYRNEIYDVTDFKGNVYQISSWLVKKTDVTVLGGRLTHEEARCLGNYFDAHEEGMTVGDRIAARRVAVYLTQDELSRAISVHRRTVAAWETGQNSPRFEQIRALVPILGNFTVMA